ncbi:MAG: TIGR03364 family FAD-dependent oxidoreductase, partial [Brevibacterium aurantiacum]|nr:TIGR03364 family FAD-dependent oxidoreductase [Brevibacterium aurantiacum]
LGIDEPVVRQRWLGQYADSTETNLILERPDARTTVAVVTSGIGMTLSFGIADRILGGSPTETDARLSA